MSIKPKRIEISHYMIKLIIGLIAIFLAILTSCLSNTPLESISASYHAGGSARNIFVGFLFAIFVLLLAYNGRSLPEMVMSKLAAVAAVGVAMFPCKCEIYPEIIPKAHGISAAIMFAIIALFCLTFFRRAIKKTQSDELPDADKRKAKIRAGIYAFCGSAIVLSIVFLTIDNLSGGKISELMSRFTFYGEAVGLIAFGIAWLTASLIIPIITGRKEIITLSPFSDREEKSVMDE